MAVQCLFAQFVVTDGEAAEGFYTRLFGRAPDSRPMAGLTEWHWPPGSDPAAGRPPSFGVQVWVDPDRAGRSSATAFDDDLEGIVARLIDAGIEFDGPNPGGGARTVEVSDPDGNRFVFVG